MTYQFELQFRTDYIFDLLVTIHQMACANSNASHSVKTVNSSAFMTIYAQLHDLMLYSIDSLDCDTIKKISQSRQNSLDLYWGV